MRINNLYTYGFRTVSNIPNNLDLSARALDSGKIIHFEVVELVFEVGSTLGNTLVDMYAKCSSLEDAYNTFDNLFLKDIVSWNTMIGGYVDN